MDRACNSQAIVASIVVNRFIDQFDFSSLHVPQLIKVQQEVRQISDAIGYVCPELRQALDRLGAELETAAWQRKSPLATRQGKQDKRLLRLLKFLTSISLVIGTVSGMTAQSAYAAAVVMPAIGDKVRNPKTNQDEEVVAIIGGAPAVLTKENNIIFLADEVGDTYSITADNVTKNYTVIAVDDGKVNVQDEDDSIIAGITIVTDATPPTPPAAGGENGSGETTVNFPVPAGNEQKQDIRAGISGGSGRDGGGVNLCVPFTDICTFAGYPPTAGGAGANGPTFSVTIGETEFGGEIASNADKLPGIKIASIGGNGGSGGDSYALGGYAGQAGGTAGNGGTVSATNRVNISTSGDGSHGMWVFSQAGKAGAGGDGYIATGGGGGSGGDGEGLASIGGSGSLASDGGTVTVGHYGSIQTTKNLSTAILAQSVGGGGGNGGASTSVSLFVGLALGGSGDGGGDGGLVTANFLPRTFGEFQLPPLITTKGDRSRGVFLQSVGGGGGNGGMAVQASGGPFGAASFAIGGSGGKGGKGGEVRSTGQVAISTDGDYSQGYFAQSVGGGGGNGGASIAVAASAGEGFSAAFALSLGGSGGNGGKGGTVDVNSGGSIQTHGAYSTGFVAQSVGGGGGTGGFSINTAIAASDGTAISGGIGIGGSGGKGGDGGTVTAIFDGDIVTGPAPTSANIPIDTVIPAPSTDILPSDYRSSLGALIQSVGDGGGDGGFNVSAAVALAGGASGGATVGLGGTGGDGGDGGIVHGTIGGAVRTFGEQSTGILIQSAGGGGGSGAMNISGGITTNGQVTAGFGGSAGSGGHGGLVIANVNADLYAEGYQATGLTVQSIGGGGNVISPHRVDQLLC